MEMECKFDGKKCDSNPSWNNNKCWCECKKHICGKEYIWSPASYSCKHSKYLASIIDNSAITCDEIIEEETKTVTTNFNEKKKSNLQNRNF